MKVAFFAKTHKRSGITRHMQRGMVALGHDVLRVNRPKIERLLGKRLGATYMRWRMRSYRPDALIVFTRDLSADLIAEFSALTTTSVFFDDCNKPLRPEVLELGRAADVFFLTNRGQLEEYEAQGVKRAVYVTGGCDPDEHYQVPFDPEFASDVAFIGKCAVEGDRADLLRALSQRFDTKIYGSGWQKVGLTPAREEAHAAEYRKICASAKVVIGIDSYPDVDLYFSNRTWITLGCGGFLCTRYIPNLEEILREGEHLVWYRDIDDCLEVVGRYLADDEARARIKAAGFAYAHANYRYQHMMERMLSALQETAGSSPPALGAPRR